jgi:hypothetical protein
MQTQRESNNRGARRLSQSRRPVLGAFGVFAALAASAGLGGCRSEHDEAPPERAGTVTLSLMGTAEGVAYRLRHARFTIAETLLPGASAVLESDTDPNATVLTTALPAGDYSINLETGWTLERSETLQAVEATLISPNPTSFQIRAASTTNAIYRFATGGGVVTVGSGTLAIGIDISVNDGGVGGTGGAGSSNPVVDAGSSATDALSEAGGSVCPAPMFQCADLDLSPAGVEWNETTGVATLDIGRSFGPSGAATLEYEDCRGIIPLETERVSFVAGKLTVRVRAMSFGLGCVVVRFTIDRCGTASLFAIRVSDANSAPPRFSCE